MRAIMKNKKISLGCVLLCAVFIVIVVIGFAASFQAVPQSLGTSESFKKPELSEEALILDEREWITMKEQAVREAGAEVEGGSLHPFVTSTKAVEWTKIRVYELMKRLEKKHL